MPPNRKKAPTARAGLGLFHPSRFFPHGVKPLLSRRILVEIPLTSNASNDPKITSPQARIILESRLATFTAGVEE